MATDMTDGLKNIFLAGVGAMAYTGEKSKELLETLISKGEAAVDQSSDLNSELRHRVGEATETVRVDTLEAFMATLTPEMRAEFAAKAAEIAEKENAKAAEKTDAAAEAEAEVVEVEAVVEEAAE